MRLLWLNSASLGILVSLYCFSGYMHINTLTAQKPHVHQSPQHPLSSWHLPSIDYKTKPETFTKLKKNYFSFSTNGQLKCLWPEMLESAPASLQPYRTSSLVNGWMDGSAKGDA